MLIAVLQAVASGLAVGGAYALIALGFSITFTTTKTLNFSHGDFVAIGAFIGVSVLLVMAGHPLNATSFSGINVGSVAQVIAVIAALLVMGLLGVLLYLLAVRPFAGKVGMSWVMSTIGFGIILQSLALVIWGPAPVNLPSPLGDDVIRFFGIG